MKVGTGGVRFVPVSEIKDIEPPDPNMDFGEAIKKVREEAERLAALLEVQALKEAVKKAHPEISSSNTSTFNPNPANRSPGK